MKLYYKEKEIGTYLDNVIKLNEEALFEFKPLLKEENRKIDQSDYILNLPSDFYLSIETEFNPSTEEYESRAKLKQRIQPIQPPTEPQAS